MNISIGEALEDLLEKAEEREKLEEELEKLRKENEKLKKKIGKSREKPKSSTKKCVKKMTQEKGRRPEKGKQKKEQKGKAKTVLRTLKKSEKNPVITRCQGKCEFPNCNSPYHAIHHLIPFALSGKHEDLVALCDLHHQLIHSGLIQNPFDPPSEWRIGLDINKNSLKYLIDQKYQRRKLMRT